MNIKSAQYGKSLDNPSVNVCINIVIGEDEKWSVPINPDNSHYQSLMKWVADGNTIEEAD
jgi:hypothetical protein